MNVPAQPRRAARFEAFSRFAGALAMAVRGAWQGASGSRRRRRLAEMQGEMNDNARQREQGLAALRLSEERLRLAIDGARLGTWHWDIRTGALEWSEACLAIFGIPTGTVMSYEKFLAALHPDDRARADAAVCQALKDRSDFDIEYRAVWPDGSEHWITAKGRGYYDAGGEPVRMEGVVLDITDRKRAEEELRRAHSTLEARVQKRTAELAAANRELEAFSYSVSHDLRAPLRALDGFARILAGEHRAALQPEALDCLDEIIDSARQMGALIDDLLAFSRIGKQALDPRAVDPAGMVRECLKTLAPEQEGRAVEIVIGEMESCQADPALLRQVWMNLLGNALKYTRKRTDARIEIGCCEEDGARVYFVRDNGVGFDMKHVGKLFGIFQRLHSAEDFEGTGIGLATVQRIIHRHGGRIWAQAARNEGATFYFALPGRTV